ncbi:MAG: hypothetical protein ACTSPV_09615 [Candidatus Hodarchaeales archaeon]
MVEEPEILFAWSMTSCEIDKPVFWLGLVRKIPPQVIWERMKHKAENIKYFDSRRGYSRDWGVYLNYYDPICEEQGNYLWSYKV